MRTRYRLYRLLGYSPVRAAGRVMRPRLLTVAAFVAIVLLASPAPAAVAAPGFLDCGPVEQLGWWYRDQIQALENQCYDCDPELETPYAHDVPILAAIYELKLIRSALAGAINPYGCSTAFLSS